jgi:hypothetical protein
VSATNTYLKRRNKELCKPILQLFFKAKPDIQNEIVSMLEYFLKAKGQRKANTIDASLYTVLKELLFDIEVKAANNNKRELPSSLIWDTVVLGTKIAGYYDGKKPNL